MLPQIVMLNSKDKETTVRFLMDVFTMVKSANFISFSVPIHIMKISYANAFM